MATSSATMQKMRSRSGWRKKPKLAKSELIGRARRIDDARGRYVQFAKDTFPEHLRLDGLKVVIDCANGAAYHVAPEALWELGAEVVPIGVTPNGLNINEDCGSTSPQLLQETVVASGADIGIALDGDADRLIVVDEKGQIVDGDQLMALIALGLHARGELRGGAVVATVMSNLGLERKLGEAGLKLIRSKVGDRYVLEEMRKNGCNVGGEQSGHIILADHATTGDGLVAGLQVLAALVEAKRPASELLRQFEPLPQLLKNVRFGGGAEPLETDSVQKAHRSRRGRARGSRTTGHSQVRDRAPDPGHGRRATIRRWSSDWSTIFARRSGPRREPLFGICRPNDEAVHMDNFAPGSGSKTRTMTSTARILIIAGSDSGGGAGIQADIKTVAMLGGHPMTAVTAITAQNTVGVSAVHPVPTEMILAQIEAVVSDIGVDAVKIGMIGGAFAAEQVAARLERLKAEQPGIPIVFDPVMVATSGSHACRRCDDCRVRAADGRSRRSRPRTCPN